MAAPTAGHPAAAGWVAAAVLPDALEREITAAVRSWRDELREILIEKHGEEAGLEFCARFGTAFPEAYKEDVSPWVASFDVVHAAAVDAGEDLRIVVIDFETVAAAIRRQPVYDAVAGGTRVPLRLAPSGSVFVVFRERPAEDHVVSLRRDDVSLQIVNNGLEARRTQIDSHQQIHDEPL